MKRMRPVTATALLFVPLSLLFSLLPDSTLSRRLTKWEAKRP